MINVHMMNGRVSVSQFTSVAHHFDVRKIKKKTFISNAIKFCSIGKVFKHEISCIIWVPFCTYGRERTDFSV